MLGEVAAVLGGRQGHGPEGRQQVQQADHPLGLRLLRQQLAVGGLGLLPQPPQAVEQHQAHGGPGLAQPPGRELVQEGEEVTKAPAEAGLGRRLFPGHGPFGRRLQQRFQIPGTLPEDVLQQGQVRAGEAFFPDQLPGQ